MKATTRNARGLNSFSLMALERKPRRGGGASRHRALYRQGMNGQCPSVACSMGPDEVFHGYPAGRSVQDVVQDFVDDTGGDSDQEQIGAGLLPFVAIVAGQAANQAAVELLGDTGRQWFAACKVLADARR